MSDNLIAKVAELWELEQKATPGPWSLVGLQTYFGDNEIDDPEMIAKIRNAAHAMLDVLAGFQEGDVRCMKAIRGLVQAATGPDTWSEEMGCIERMLEMAREMESPNESR